VGELEITSAEDEKTALLFEIVIFKADPVLKILAFPSTAYGRSGMTH
jgi:hypothetical protein